MKKLFLVKKETKGGVVMALAIVRADDEDEAVDMSGLAGALSISHIGSPLPLTRSGLVYKVFIPSHKHK